MLSVLVPLIVVLFLAMVIQSLMEVARENAPLVPSTWLGESDRKKLEELIELHGANSNAFLAIYPGFEYFWSEGREGVIAYVSRAGAWVAGEPLAPADEIVALMKAFVVQAQAHGKRAVFVAVRESVALAAREAGLSTLQIGSEPRFVLDRYPPTGKTWNNVIPAAGHLEEKGAKVSEFKPDELALERRRELDTVLRAWRDSRKMDSLSFFNQVRPWLYSAKKRYFLVEFNDKVQAFVAAIPMPAAGAWYLIDLIRRPNSPPGSTELLALGAMKAMGQAGVREVTLGVAPLSGLNRVSENLAVYRVMRFLYRHGGAFYGFRSLYEYKHKFAPTSEEAVFLVHDGLGLRGVLGVFRAFLPSGFLRAGFSSVFRMIRRFRLSDWIKARLAPTVVVKSVPPSWGRLLRRCKFTAALFVINIALYVPTTDPYGFIFPDVEGAWGFSWASFQAHPLRALVLSPFLHWNLAHLGFNLVMMAVFVGGLEYLAGSAIAVMSYVSAMVLANPITAFALIRGLSGVFDSIQPTEIDVGASLGIIGCAGALLLMIRQRWVLVVFVAGLSSMQTALTGAFMPLNHCVALLIGFAAGWWALRS